MSFSQGESYGKTDIIFWQLYVFKIWKRNISCTNFKLYSLEDIMKHWFVSVFLCIK
jgi:hypothetical protein